jgi:hypothetical protein
MEHRRCSDHHDAPPSWLRTGLVLAEAADATAQPHPDIAVLETIAADRSALATLDALAQAGTARAAASVPGVHHSAVLSRLAAAMIALGYDPQPSRADAVCPDAYAAPAPARSAAVNGLVRPIASGPIASGPIASRAYRQPSAGATWVRMLSMAWAL